MKRIFLYSALVLFAVSCGKPEKTIDDVIDSQNLPEIRAKKLDLSKQQAELTTKLNKLDEAIAKLDPNKNLPLVTTALVKDTIFKHYTEVQGDVTTKQNIIIYPEYSGVLENVYVKEGDKVSKGQILAKIDDGGLSSQLSQLESRAILAKTTYERQKRLWDQNIGSEIEYLQSKTNYEASQKSVDQSKSQLEKTVVRAPFSGTIDNVISDEGQVVSPGANQLFRLVNLNEMYVEANVPENYLSKIKKGTSVVVRIDAVNKTFEGSVRQVGNFINPDNRTFKIEVAIPNKENLLKPNLIASVKLNDYTAESSITIPENVIQQNSLGEQMVYVLQAKNDSIGIAKKVLIETGYTSDAAVEVTKGLKEGDRLILEGSKSLRDQQEVKIKN